MRADDRGAGRRDPLREPRRRPRHRTRRRRRHVRGVVLANGEHIAADHVVLAVGHSARDTFEMLHERGVAHGGQAVLDRLSHRASAVADRPRALRPERRPSAARRRRLQAGASRQQRPLGLQLLHVPGRHRGGGDLGAGPRRHQRHEPVFAQRAQRQRRHRRRHHAGGLSRRIALAGIAFQRHWEARAFELGGGNYARAGAARRRLPRRTAVDRARRRCMPSYTPGVHADRSRRPACPTTPSRRSARRCPPSTARSRASPWPTRC